MNNIEKIDRLLNLYFAGETTIAQEQELKKYFASQHVAAKHKVYQQIFETFETEKSEIYPENLPKMKILTVRKKPFKTLITSAAIAASILLMIGIFRTGGDSYVIIKGKRINDKELALQIAQTEMNKISASLKSSLKSLQTIDHINETMKTLHKIENIKNKVQNTLNKINIKL
ncbi:MAG: hypothetical protein LBP63_10360 [Prevotellaceae bacterium]|jgi:hypothetical protein|nr:hypothetical protein [Prevotellaceae bacterium]